MEYLLVCWLLKVDEEITCLQCVLFAEHGEHLPSFIILLCSVTSLYSILLLLISSFKFLLQAYILGLYIKCFNVYGKLFYYSVETGYMLILAEFFFWGDVVPFFKSYFLSIFQLLLYVHLLAAVGNLDWQTSVSCNADLFDSKCLTIETTIF